MIRRQCLRSREPNTLELRQVQRPKCCGRCAPESSYPRQQAGHTRPGTAIQNPDKTVGPVEQNQFLNSQGRARQVCPNTVLEASWVAASARPVQEASESV
jgi:hypothetical protein